jgi:hypothetical protein
MQTRILVVIAACASAFPGCSGASGTPPGGTGGTIVGTGGSTSPQGAGGAATGGSGITVATGSGGSTPAPTGSGGVASGGTGGTAGSIAADHPGDVGIENDPDVVWTEDFEEGSTAAMLARYEDKKPDGLTLDTDVPAQSSGRTSGKLVASGAGPNAVDFYKKLAPGYDELYVRYYAKYQANVEWHHTGVWVGGYNPASNWPNPQAGLLPSGEDRFAIALEPMEQGEAPRMDSYNYWMRMHSWMDNPSGSTAYYGNSVIHDPTLVAKAEWQCFEIHVKVNPSPTSGAGAEWGFWVDDRSVIQLTDTSPLGYWVKDKFCSEATVATECTDYRPAAPALVPLDMQVRSTTALNLNYVWPQNYITSGGAGAVWYDDMVVAKRRVGCIR